MEGINIFDYDKIEIYSAVTFNNDNSEIWASTSIYSSDIKLSTAEDIKTTFAVSIASNHLSYRVPHYYFTSNNKIVLWEETKAGWNTAQSTYKIKIVGYKY